MQGQSIKPRDLVSGYLNVWLEKRHSTIKRSACCLKLIILYRLPDLLCCLSGFIPLIKLSLNMKLFKKNHECCLGKFLFCDVWFLGEKYLIPHIWAVFRGWLLIYTAPDRGAGMKATVDLIQTWLYALFPWCCSSQEAGSIAHCSSCVQSVAEAGRKCSSGGFCNYRPAPCRKGAQGPAGLCPAWSDCWDQALSAAWRLVCGWGVGKGYGDR